MGKPKTTARDPKDLGPNQSDSEQIEFRVLRAIRQIIRSVDLYSHKLAHDFGITVPQLLCLTKIGEFDSLTIKSLSEQVHLSASTLVGIIDRLEKRGLVDRNRSTTDRRQIGISITSAGTKLIANTPSPLQDALADALKTLPADERLTIAQSLENIVSMMQIGQIEASPILSTGDVSAEPPMAINKQ